ncbi:MAG: hypothetical protein P1U30_10965 [Phycisphaerales bacterium]|nr:hypothetical protein [Phycisphaerales bacterium]
MKSALIVFMGVCIALLSSITLAQPFIEIEIDASKEDNFGVTITHARVVIDASAGLNEFDRFDLIDAEFSVHFRSNVGFAGSADPVLNIEHHTIENMFGSYVELIDGTSQQLYIHLAAGTVFRFYIIGTGPELAPTVMTLPDDPEDYLISADALTAGAQVRVTSFEEFVEINEFGSMGVVLNRDGAIEYRVRLVDDPRVEPCLADLNGDGSLNFLDVSLYLQLYGNGCD